MEKHKMTCFTLWGTASEWPKKSQIWSGKPEKVGRMLRWKLWVFANERKPGGKANFNVLPWRMKVLLCPNFTGLMKAQPWTDLDDTPVLNLSYHYQVRTGAAASSCIQEASWCFPNWASGHSLYLFLPVFSFLVLVAMDTLPHSLGATWMLGQ